jgi:hypothetical protein
VPALLEHERRDPRLGEAGVVAPVSGISERRVRDDLRAQIARLELRLGEVFASAFPRDGIDWHVGAIGGPRVLGIEELERVRDALAYRLSEAQAELARRADVEEANRGVLESMIAEPERYRWVRVSNDDIGERGCRHWHSRPRWGIVGLLLNWWRVKVSSGCPLAKGLRPPEHEAPLARKRRKRRPRRPPPAPAEASARAPEVVRDDAARRRSAARRRDQDEHPPAPWGSFPLVEICVLVGIVMLVLGFIVQGQRGSLLIAVGLVLGSLAGLELSVREHFAGYRSHTVLLAGAASIAVLAGLFYLGPEELSPGIRFAAAAAVFAAAAWALTAAFRRRSGQAFKLR